MRIGYSTWGMPQVEIGEALAAIARIGYQGAEISVAPRWSTAIENLTPAKSARIRRLLDEHDLVCTSVIRNASMIAEDAAENERNMDSLKQATDLAVEWTRPGEPAVMTSHLGGRPEDWEDKRELAAERLLELADYAQQQGAVVAVEIHCVSMLNLIERVDWLFGRVKHPAARLNFDISHMEVIGVPIDESVPALAPYSIHTHVKDQRGRYPDHEFLTPGEGPFDFAHYLRAMDTAGYDGFITAEVSVMVQRRPDYDPFFHAQLSYWTLYKAFQVAGLPIG